MEIMISIAFTAVLIIVAVLAMILHELLKIRAALGALAILLKRGIPAFDEEVKTSAKAALLGLSCGIPPKREGMK